MSTYTPIATQTLGSAASSVIFSIIPQGYTDLVLVINHFMSAQCTVGIRFNSDTGSNYSSTNLRGNGTTATSGRISNTTAIDNSLDDLVRNPNVANAVTIWNIQNYSNNATNKTVLYRHNNATSDAPGAAAGVGLWRNTSAITSITLLATSSSQTFQSGSTFTLYGIAVGNSSAKADGGSSVTTDGTYYYHTFKSSGAFIPRQALTVDYLVVAGGGGGGTNFGSGGGAGGLRCTVGATGGGGSLESALSLTSGATYTVAVGAGGAAQTIDNVLGYSGSNSVFSTITSTGGGAGAGAVTNGGTGGSGGGAGGGSTTTTGGTGTPNQGYAGGNNSTGADDGGAGGGGAGAVGSNTTGNATGGAGGAGVTTSISGTSTSYAGGGGGGNSGSASAGGGAGGASTGNGTAGTANTGGGGGGGGQYSGDGAAGGSGIVIIRYAV